MRHRLATYGLLAVSFLVITSGCGQSDATPHRASNPVPLRYSFRPSKLDTAGLVLQLENPSQARLACKLDAWNKTFGQHREHTFHLGPRESIELGLLEMSWSFKTGETVEIRADGFDPVKFSVP